MHKQEIKISGTGTQKKAFTLVELIIVITILTILATIAFVSFSNYTASARDANRVATLTNIEKWLRVFQVQTWQYPIPDNFITISASWIDIWYQWNIWENINILLNLSRTNDPLDNSKYSYTVSHDNKNFQLLSFFENQKSTFINTSQASDLTSRYPFFNGDKVWFFLESNNAPIHYAKTDYDILLDSKNIYYVYSDRDVLFWSWQKIYNNIASIHPSILQNKYLKSLNQDLVLSFNVDDLILSWSIYMLQDNSQNQFHGTCYDWNLIVGCWAKWVWPQFDNQKWIFFDGINDSIRLSHSFWRDFFYTSSTQWSNFSISFYIENMWSWYSSVLWQRFWDSFNVVFTTWSHIQLWIDDLRDRSPKYWSVVWRNYITINYIYDVNDSYVEFILNWSKVETIYWARDWNGTDRQNNFYIWWQSRKIWDNPLDTLTTIFPWYFHWYIDEIHIFNRELSEYESLNLFK